MSQHNTNIQCIVFLNANVLILTYYVKDWPLLLHFSIDFHSKTQHVEELMLLLFYKIIESKTMHSSREPILWNFEQLQFLATCSESEFC